MMDNDITSLDTLLNFDIDDCSAVDDLDPMANSLSQLRLILEFAPKPWDIARDWTSYSSEERAAITGMHDNMHRLLHELETGGRMPEPRAVTCRHPDDDFLDDYWTDDDDTID